MSFPVLPLIDVLRRSKELTELNIFLSVLVFAVVAIFACIYLIDNATNRSYRKKNARRGFVALFIAIFVAVVGMVYILIVALAALVLFVLVYWVLYRVLIRNFIAMWWGSEKKEE